MTRLVAGLVLLALSLSGCATSPFRSHVAAHRWADAARAFAADSTLLHDPDALYAAAQLFGTPGRPTWDPERAGELLRQLIANHPRSDRARDAAALLPLLDQVVALRGELRRLKDIDLQPAAVRLP